MRTNFKISEFMWERELDILTLMTAEIPVDEFSPMDILIEGKWTTVMFGLEVQDNVGRYSIYTTKHKFAYQYIVRIPWAVK